VETTEATNLTATMVTTRGQVDRAKARAEAMDNSSNPRMTTRRYVQNSLMSYRVSLLLNNLSVYSIQ